MGIDQIGIADMDRARRQAAPVRPGPRLRSPQRRANQRRRPARQKIALLDVHVPLPCYSVLWKKKAAASFDTAPFYSTRRMREEF